jgi:hypothetical protein
VGKTTTVPAKKSKQVFVRKDTLAFCPVMVQLGTGYEMHMYRNAEDINEAEWEALNHSGNLFTSLKFLRGQQFTAPPEMSFIYIIIRKGKKNIAGYVFQSIHLSVEVLTDVLAPLTKQKSIVGHMSEWLTRCREEKGMRVLICGNNFVSGEHGVLTAKGSNSAEAFSLLPEVVKTIVQKVAKPVKFSVILVKDYYASHKQKPEVLLTKKRYHSFGVEPEMILKINPEWNVFDDYLAAMSKKYRNRTKSVLRHSSQLVEHHLDEESLRSVINDIYPLYAKMHQKARFRLAALTPHYFVEMKRLFPAQFGVKMYTLNGKAVGFRSFFLNGEQLEAHFIGVDYHLNKEHDIYNRILYDFVDDTIKTGRNELLLGRTAAEIKSTIGATAHNLTCYIRHRNSFSNQIIRPFIDYLKPSEWTPRNPFRNGE